VGGYWRNNNFYYNTAVTRVNTTIIRNTYVHNVTIINNTRVSYNGGRGGLNVRPLPAENVAWREQHMAPLPEQVAHAREASTNREQWASVNHGRPAVLTAPRPLETAHRAPAPMPPQVQNQVRQEQMRVAENRPVARPGTEPRPEARPAQPMNRPEARPAPEPNRPEARPAPENRPAAHPEARPAPQPNRPEARPEQPANRPEPRPQPESRPQPRPESRPAPQQRPEEHPQAARPEERPEARPAEPRPAPEARPESRPAPQQHPQEHPQPQKEEHHPQR